MIKNYIKIALRNLRRNRTYAILNVLGLAVGIAASLLIFVVIRFETSFDDYHPNRQHIYRIATEYHNQDGVSYGDGVSFPVADALRLDFPNVKKVAGIFKDGNTVVTIPATNGQTEKKFKEQEVYYADPSFFDMFSFPWLAGQPQTALKNPFSVAITQAIAEKFFGDWKKAVGRTIRYNSKDIYTVTGILANPPVNTDFPLQLVASYSTLKDTHVSGNLQDWVSTYGGACVFVTLPDNLSQETFNEQLKAFARKHRPADYAADIFFAQSLGDMHFNKEMEVFSSHTFSRELITALTIIGIFLILIACVNFVNLATAQAVNRSKEVGVRKVLGSSRRQLAFQFISETAMITVFAIILAIGLAMACLPMLNGLMETKMKMQILNDPALIGFLLATTVSVTLLSGIYPALIVSGFNPITALKNKITARMVGGLSLRRVLVMLQFAIAHVLIIGTLVVVSQTEYFRHASLGFDKEAMLNVPLPGDSISRTRFESLRNTLLQNSGIKELSFSFTSPSDNSNWSSDFTYDHAAKRTDFGANLKWSDANYFKIYNMKFVAGHAYQPSDTVREFVVNETLLHKLGITDPNKAINKELNFWGGDKKGTIVGVVKDFNSYSLHEPMAPVVLSTWKDVYQLLNIRIKPGNEKATLAYIEKSWIAAFPDNLYSYEFLEKKIDNFYKQENQLSRLYKIFAVIAIFISCLGLYGLVSFMAVQRVKEVGIRKVLGASVRSIVYLFSRELTLLILVAFVIAAPLAYFLMRQWLQDFTYRIQLGAGVFVLSIVGSLVIAWLTVGYRSMKAAVASPVKNLRAE